MLSGSQPANGQRPRRIGRTAAAVGVVCGLVPVLGGAFSATISMSTPAVEFGQGVAAMVHCDSTLEISTITEWSEAASAFEVSSFVVDGVDTGACLGKTLTVAAYNTGAQIDVCSSGCAADDSSFTHVITALDSTITFNVVAGVSPSSITDLAVTTS